MNCPINLMWSVLVSLSKWFNNDSPFLSFGLIFWIEFVGVSWYTFSLQHLLSILWNFEFCWQSCLWSPSTNNLTWFFYCGWIVTSWSAFFVQYIQVRWQDAYSPIDFIPFSETPISNSDTMLYYPILDLQLRHNALLPYLLFKSLFLTPKLFIFRKGSAKLIHGKEHSLQLMWYLFYRK